MKCEVRKINFPIFFTLSYEKVTFNDHFQKILVVFCLLSVVVKEWGKIGENPGWETKSI